MKRMIVVLCVAALLASGSRGGAAEPETEKKAPAQSERTVRATLSTSMGDITLELEPAKAPISVENFLAYARSGYYAGTVFHRVIPGFVVQGGGLDAELHDKVDGRLPPIKNESANDLKNVRGSVAMARTSAPDSATSQFFINVADNTFLDRENARDKVGYAVFGRVVEGMDVVEKIEEVTTETRGMHRDVPVEPIVINSVSVAGDETKAVQPTPTVAAE